MATLTQQELQDIAEKLFTQQLGMPKRKRSSKTPLPEGWKPPMRDAVDQFKQDLLDRSSAYGTVTTKVTTKRYFSERLT